ncbi:hypothetical protein [Gloeothece verrucosa]|uniref:Nuclear transport factor 2 family protein n=1 Tax=Gloeothece verrucosa (strain PCC 7822) TaxID=497965 RepID=E0U604_GLOV7|nr:hypothetical protein [Gloeothece verrucosa]ADN17113.1 conserved hypothetical protein [Gloeothece verrucosa PCC 7822]
MRNKLSLRQLLLLSPFQGLILFLLSIGIVISPKTLLQAQTQPVPNDLQTLITQIQTAANRHDIQGVMQFYSPQFTNSDGLTYPNLQQSLTQLWKDYKDVKYNTLVESWNQEGNKTVAQTVTKIQATGQHLGRTFNLTSTITSKQHFQNQKLVYQEIISEKTEITAGNNPPQIDVRLPQSVKVGQPFDFDVIVEQPLGEDRLAGAALNEKISSEGYLNPSALELDLLPAGGIFKRIPAIQTPQNHWFSAIIVRGDGMSIVTQRVNVEK